MNDSCAGAPADKARKINEPECVDAAQKGDVSAFERLYRRHVGRIYALCLRMSGDRAEAEDLTQEVFIRTWKKIGSFKGKSAFSSWLHRLAVNVILDQKRSRRNRRLDAYKEGSDMRTAVAEAGITHGAVDLERAVALLPPGARTVFVLHDVEGYRHDEIVRLAGIAAGTSKAQLHRARRILRRILEK